jgi:regulator of protease activity HflC (stomatin/prohibitin superfamily)
MNNSNNIGGSSGTGTSKSQHIEFPAKAIKGLSFLLLLILLELVFTTMFVIGIILLVAESYLIGGLLLGLGIFFADIVIPLLFLGFKIVKPNEARVMTLFGRYIGTLRNDGIYYLNPLATAVKVRETAIPSKSNKPSGVVIGTDALTGEQGFLVKKTSKISLKSMAFANERQKINDLLGNPIIIGINVIWRVVDTAKAVFDVDDYQEYLSIQSDSALRNIVRMYPYDSTDLDSGNEKSLRGSSQEIAEMLRNEIQKKVDIAGLEITDARITHLAYAPEIAAAMLQRQQASAIIDARTLIVEGAVSMVQSALNRLSEQEIVEFDDERKAVMVSNLMVVLCGNRDVQPIVNSGSLY